MASCSSSLFYASSNVILPVSSIRSKLVGPDIRLTRGSQTYPQSQENHGIWNTMSSAGESRTLSPIPFHIDFQVATRREWSNVETNLWTEFTNSFPSNASRYNLLLRQHKVDSVVTSPSVVSSVRDDKSENQRSRPTHANGTHRSKGSGSAQNSFHKRLSSILPIDTRKKLQGEPKMCVALTNKRGHPQCTRKTKGSLEVLNNILSTLTGQTIEPVDDSSITFVRDLIGTALCGRSHRRKHMSDFDEIRKGLNKLSEDDRTVFDQWIMALVTEPPSIDEDLSTCQTWVEGSTESSPVITRRQETPAISFTINFPTTCSTAHLSRLASDSAYLFSPHFPTRCSLKTYIPNFTPYVLKSAPKSTEDCLRKRIMRPLTKREVADGYIYMYWFPGIFGYIKIGVTANANVTERLEQWRRKCGHAVEAVGSQFWPVKHAYRVEALVQVELKDVRFRELGCRGCGGNHVEWFQDKVAHAKAVINKYGEWMETNRYECGVGGEETSGWQLKPGEDIEKLCQPLKREVKKMKTGKRNTEKWKTKKRSENVQQ